MVEIYPGLLSNTDFFNRHPYRYQHWQDHQPMESFQQIFDSIPTPEQPGIAVKLFRKADFIWVFCFPTRMIKPIVIVPIQRHRTDFL